MKNISNQRESKETKQTNKQTNKQTKWNKIIIWFKYKFADDTSMNYKLSRSKIFNDLSF